jgi:dihydroorotate dehydrogenase
MVAAGALGWDGRGYLWEKPLIWAGLMDPRLFTVVTKSVTMEPRDGRRFAMHPITKGIWNNMGIPNRGLEWWINRYEDRINYCHPLVLSIGIDNNLPLADLVRRVNDLRVVGVELNVSCPNTSHQSLTWTSDWLSIMKSLLDKPIIIKLNYAQYKAWGVQQLKAIMQQYTDIVSFNSVPAHFLVKDMKGAISGYPAQPFNWTMMEDLIDAGFQVIGPDPWYQEDIDELFGRGAAAISFGSIHLLRPTTPTLWVRRIMRERIKSVAGITGRTRVNC